MMRTARAADRSDAPALVVAYAPRARTRSVVRASLPRRRGRVVLARAVAEFSASFRSGLVDAAVVDLGASAKDALGAAALARHFPSVPFFGLSPFRPVDATVIAHCAGLEFADVLADAVDDGVLRYALSTYGFSSRFAAALREPPPVLSLTNRLQRAAWRAIVAQPGQPVRTSALAATLGVTREHLSRSFASGGAPTLKRVIDLVRVLVAAELAKNSGYDLRDIARILGFASSSHLSATSQRLVGTRGASLSALRAVDLLERFPRSRGAGYGRRGSR